VRQRKGGERRQLPEVRTASEQLRKIQTAPSLKGVDDSCRSQGNAAGCQFVHLSLAVVRLILTVGEGKAKAGLSVAREERENRPNPSPVCSCDRGG
jgi:hypothetical protein